MEEHYTLIQDRMDMESTPSAMALDGDAPSQSAMERGETPEHQSCLTLLRNAFRNPDQLTAMISNYSTSYNAVNVGIVLPVLNYSMQSKGSDEADPSLISRAESSPVDVASSIARRLYENSNEEDDEQDSLVASSLLAGMIFGQLIGGFLGDVLGRRNAMLLVMILQIGGSLGSAFFISTDNETEGLTALEQLAAWRFILGIGAGGVYPLAAVMSAENKAEDGLEEGGTTTNEGSVTPKTNVTNMEHEWNGEEDCHPTENGQNGGHATASATEKVGVCVNRPFATSNSDATTISFRRIALTFSTQGLGFLTVPLLAYPMLSWNINADAIWRALLGVGALPGVLVLYLRLCSSTAHVSRRKINENEESVDSFISNVSGTINKQDRGNIITGNELDVDETNEESSKLELPESSKANNVGGNVTDEDEGNRTFQAAVSSLFSDVTSSDFNGCAVDENENELALVDNSHLENGSENNKKHSIWTTSVRNRSRGLWESIQAEPDLGRKFAGTAGIWFLFDVTFYGNTLFEPLVLEAAFDSHSANGTNGYELLQTTVRGSLLISLLSLPGYFVTVFLIGRRTCVYRSLCSSSSSTRCGSALCFPCDQTPVYIQMQGFFFMFLLYIIIGLFWEFLSNFQWLILVLYAGTFFFANYGPNSTTFLLPSITYSEECRSTLNGMSAAAGKIGALVGASVFAPAADMWGENVVMVCCGCVSALALLLTKFCLGGGTRA